MYFSRQPSPEEAMRRALERCGHEAGAPCMVVAVDDSFVVPIPATAKVVGFYRPTALTAVPSGLRDDIARRLANATSGWNAVAEGFCPIGGGDAGRIEEIFGSPWNAMQRTAIVAGGDLAVGGASLFECMVRRKGDDAVQFGLN
jgi:hypothetical protein